MIDVVFICYELSLIHLDDASTTEYKDLISELKILIHIGQNKHIVNLLAACTKGLHFACFIALFKCSKGLCDQYVEDWSFDKVLFVTNTIFKYLFVNAIVKISCTLLTSRLAILLIAWPNYNIWGHVNKKSIDHWRFLIYLVNKSPVSMSATFLIIFEKVSKKIQWLFWSTVPMVTCYLSSNRGDKCSSRFGVNNILEWKKNLPCLICALLVIRSLKVLNSLLQERYAICNIRVDKKPIQSINICKYRGIIW